MTRSAGLLLAAALILSTACSDDRPGTVQAKATTTTSAGSGLRLNDVQMIGTHNSYHVAPEAKLFAAERAAVEAFGDAAKGLGDIESLDYTHAPLTTQLDRGIRSFELDVWADPVGGLFANPAAPTLLQVTDTPKPKNMDRPGFKVLHIVDIDFISTCSTFVACLSEIRDWSDTHPRHVPIVINVELKDGPLPAPLDVTKVVTIDGAQMDALDAEIRSVFPEDRLLTPDDVRGDAETLNAAVTTTGWPELDDVRGQVMLFMDNSGRYRDDYLVGHPSLEGRVLFTSSAAAGDADRAVLKVNEPEDGSTIRELVGQGYFVRTRSDADLVESTSNDTARRDVTFASGAQIVSTDFPVGEPATNGFVVTFGSGVQVRCNEVVASPCPTGPIEG